MSGFPVIDFPIRVAWDGEEWTVRELAFDGQHIHVFRCGPEKEMAVLLLEDRRRLWKWIARRTAEECFA